MDNIKIIRTANDLYRMGISTSAIASHLVEEFRLTTEQAMQYANTAGFDNE